ncbi:MAG: GAF domain-containing protein [Anaerolineae bacterium]|jgi:putative nucleotidyltransferase with HDIG domain|nr:GAF domain-containing protein [Anaerolineae bacterium]MBT7071617.1 GAF domain-containing protein [Anaerolineae bacterium]MBT7326428.1 GAF domain-containing protein [Anaerolineae bacterium]MBT7602505.1 GAF domain-containing protein [Anaerolineae bacterium]
MEDKNKTKSQLISELAELRQSASLSQGFSKYLIAVHRTSQRLQHLHSPESLAQEIIHVLEELLDYEYGAVLLINKSTKELLPFALSDQGRGSTFIDMDKAYISSRGIRVGIGITGGVAQTGKSEHIGDVRQDKRYFSMRDDIRSELCVPLINKKEIIGVINIETIKLNAYSEIDLRVLETVASQIAIAIDNANLYANLEKSHTALSLAYDNTLKGWARALELRDVEIKGHSNRVTDTTLRLARIMGIKGDDLEHVRRGALLHDIGKMGIPDSILLKPGKLTKKEWGIMRQHPVYAYKMLSDIPYLEPALDIPYYHHENWDGSGYPQGLVGEEIPHSARIFSIVDVWDALLSDRPYRKAWSKEKTYTYLIKNKGIHFDPHVVDVFMDMLKKA